MRKLIMTTATLALAGTLPVAASADDTRIEVTAGASASSSSHADQRVSERTYDVRVQGDRRDSRSDVYDEALYEAAKKTRRKDYDWFRVIDSEVERETRIRDNESSFEAGFERVPYRSCGLLTCRTDYRTERRTNMTVDFRDRETERFEVELEYEMGWGPMPANGEVYDARSVMDRYR